MAGELSSILGIDPALSRNATADTAMLRAKQGISDKKMAQIDAAAQDFESMFASEMIGNMFESVGNDPLFGGGEAEETWKGLMVQEYGKQIVSAGGFGLSKDIKAKMIEMQSAANASLDMPLPSALAQQAVMNAPTLGETE